MTALFTITTQGHTDTPEHGWDIPWLRVIHAANEIDANMFGEPITNADGVETYEHATVTHNDDDTVTVAAITEHGHDVLTVAAITANKRHPLLDAAADADAWDAYLDSSRLDD